jgi:hypothetical protein
VALRRVSNRHGQLHLLQFLDSGRSVPLIDNPGVVKKESITAIEKKQCGDLPHHDNNYGEIKQL